MMGLHLVPGPFSSDSSPSCLLSGFLSYSRTPVCHDISALTPANPGLKPLKPFHSKLCLLGALSQHYKADHYCHCICLKLKPPGQPEIQDLNYNFVVVVVVVFLVVDSKASKV